MLKSAFVQGLQPAALRRDMKAYARLHPDSTFEDVCREAQRWMREDFADVATSSQLSAAPLPDWTQMMKQLMVHIEQQVAAVADRINESMHRYQRDTDAGVNHGQPTFRQHQKHYRRKLVCLWCSRKGHAEEVCRAKKRYVDHHNGTPHFLSTPGPPGSQETVVKTGRGSERCTAAQNIVTPPIYTENVTATSRSVTVSSRLRHKEDRDTSNVLNNRYWPHTTRVQPCVTEWSPRPRKASESMNCRSEYTARPNQRRKHRKHCKPQILKDRVATGTTVIDKNKRDHLLSVRHGYESPTDLTLTHSDQPYKHASEHPLSVRNMVYMRHPGKGKNKFKDLVYWYIPAQVCRQRQTVAEWWLS